jgi:hypothetical protein
MPVGIRNNNQIHRHLPSKWAVCGGCGNKIKVEWGACPLCDANLGPEIWKEFARKNHLKRRREV